MSIALIKKINELEKRVRNLEYRLDTGCRLDTESLPDFIPVTEGNSPEIAIEDLRNNKSKKIKDERLVARTEGFSSLDPRSKK